MTPRTINILSIVCAAVVLLSAIVYTYSRSTEPGDALGLRALGVRADVISKVTMRDITGSYEFSREGEQWLYKGKNASSTKPQEMLESLRGARVELVSHKGRESDVYGLKEGSAKTLTIEGATSRTFSIGASDYRSGGVYVAAENSGDTYLVRGTLLGDFVGQGFSKLEDFSPATSTPTKRSPGKP